VYPAEIEQVLARLDGVAEAAVIGVPDQRLGEVGKAFVVLKPGAHIDEAAVIAYTREHLANFKVPRSVVFLDVLPRNPGGKVVKPTLREIDGRA
jgi:acyl-CoA synthetase (AMP-forming)/AMP-acid ligase II